MTVVGCRGGPSLGVLVGMETTLIVSFEKIIVYITEILRWPKFGNLSPKFGHFLAKIGSFESF